ncbi:MAG: ATP-binding protein [Actinomycetota bacterium]|nr:ATP-binding protein [Actinomycetota bacterium]
MKPTVRLRLTLLYGGLFLLAGAVLLGVNYALLRRSLEPAHGGVAFRVEIPPGQVFLAPRPGAGDVPPGPGEEPVDENGRPLSDVIQEFERDVREATLHQLVVRSAQALGLMAVASVGLGWVVAGRVLQPLHAITAAAKRLSEENLDERIALQGPEDELKELADTFDAMLGRLEAAFQSQRRFVANASHELRTPLSITRTVVDVTLADPHATPEQLRAMADTVREATERSERLIDSLLVLARSDRGPATRQEVDLAAATEAALAQAQGEVRALDLQVEASLGRAPVLGDPPLLERLVANVVDNAVRHNRPAGKVEVSTGVAGGEARLRVANTGDVVPASAVPSLFEPFRRLSADRTASQGGVGLGLSIVRAVAHAHDGRVDARPGLEGGLEVEVALPSAGG